MAQTGYTPIALYSSATASAAPTAGNLVSGELALNYNDGKLFYKDSAGVVQVIGTKGGVGSSSTTQVLYNSSGLVVGSANMTFDGTKLTLANDASISGLTVGKGGGSVSTNTVLGASALTTASAGQRLTAVGGSALASSTGNDNAGFGYLTLNATTSGAANTALGTYALALNTTGSNNTSVGDAALYNNTTASNNTAVGYQAGLNVTTGGANTILGQGTASTLTTGNNGVYIGTGANASSASVGQEIAIGYNATGKGSNTGFISPNGGGVYQGNNSTLWSITSDQRLKKNIVDNTVGLDAITKIQVRNFEYRLPEEITELPKENAINIQGVQLGPIAQELAQILPDCVKTESTGVMSVDASNITWYLVNAIKELKAEIDQLKGNK
jgi:Chaperone of endosialidase